MPIIVKITGSQYPFQSFFKGFGRENHVVRHPATRREERHAVAQAHPDQVITPDQTSESTSVGRDSVRSCIRRVGDGRKSLRPRGIRPRIAIQDHIPWCRLDLIIGDEQAVRIAPVVEGFGVIASLGIRPCVLVLGAVRAIDKRHTVLEDRLEAAHL